MEDMNTTETRDQNYQNPLNLLKDNAFVTAILILCFIAILEIIIGFFYSTYCSYPTMMHSDVNRRRVQYCAMAGGLGQYEQTIYDQTIKSPEDTVRSVKKEDVKIDIEWAIARRTTRPWSDRRARRSPSAPGRRAPR